MIRHAATLGDQDRWLGWPLRRLYRAQVPDDIVEIVLARALGLSGLSGAGRTPGAPEEPFDMGDAFTSGLNSERGGNASTVATLVAFDPDGRRADIVLPHLQSLASDPRAAVRACVAEVVHAMLRWHREEAIEAFVTLARDRDPKLVTTRQFEDLVVAVILTDVDAAIPLIDDLLASADPAVRERGARLATFAATDAERAELLDRAVRSDDVAVRRGAAHVLAARVRWVNEPAVREALVRLFDDSDETVREAAASFVANLRGELLAEHREFVSSFIESRAADDPTQLLLTLEHAPVPEHELTLQVAHRVIDAHGAQLGDITTGAAGDARYLTQLVLRSYTLTEDGALRAQLLDVIDGL
ncbi:MAG: HEAT repeat domain-containing protein, partial [Actinomycetota bacterium]